jgi:integrase
MGMDARAERASTASVGPTHLTAEEWAEVTAAATPDALGLRSKLTQRKLNRLFAPMDVAGKSLGFHHHTIYRVKGVVLHAMWTYRIAWGSWDPETWLAVARTMATSCRAAALAMGIHLGGLAGADALTIEGLEATTLARRLFGSEAVDREVGRVRAYLRSVGYGVHSSYWVALMTAISRLLINAGRAELEAITFEALAQAHAASPPRSTRRRAYYRVAHALHGMGLLPHGLKRRAYHQTTSLSDVDPVWVGWCERWRRTSPLAPNTVQRTYYSVLKAGRWLLREHPSVRSPDEWTRDLAIEYVAAVDHGIVGDLITTGVQHRGAPLLARSKAWLLSATRRFFIDCQEWGWCATRFDPTRTLATPRSVKALIAPNPRVLADDVWAKLLWAGLNLEEADLPTGSASFRPERQGWAAYPLALVKATAIAWLFTGLRSDELVRLRVGCIRWQTVDGAPGAGAALDRDLTVGATCLLDVPTHKTGGSYTKPVDPMVGEAFGAWETQRKPQPLFIDRKTGERAAILFAWRGRQLRTSYFNETLIPLLCRKAGIPFEDARGRITSHRARATIASQLYNAKEPMTLFELQAWLGHRSPETTQHYARITPTTLAKAYNDAGYFARNVRTIEVLIDREAITSGAAAMGTPWQYFDLGHGLCTYSFFEQCPHRMACARCDFYVPKDSTKAQLLEAKGNLQRMLAEIQLTDDERAAVSDGANAVDNLLDRLADVPTPAGPTPRQIVGKGFIPLAAIDGSSPAPRTQAPVDDQC